MKHTSVLNFRTLAVIALSVAGTWLNAADATGDWTWTTPGRNGGPDRTSTLSLKVDGAKLTGKVSAPGRDGKAVETAITDGKVDGETIAFSVVREINGNSTTAKYSGKVGAERINGKLETTRDGQPQSRDWEAKRVVAAK